MNSASKKLSILYAILAGLLITPGTVIFAWEFQILSYTRLAKTSLYLFPVMIPIALVYNHFLQIDLSKTTRKQILVNIATSLVVSLIVIRYPSDLLRYLVMVFLVSSMFFIAGSFFIELSIRIKSNLPRQTFLIVFFLVGLIGVSIFLYMSNFTRIYGDDFCFINLVRRTGFLNTINLFYHTWSGRIFTDLFMLGLTSFRFMSMIEIMLLLLVTYLALRMLRKDPKDNGGLWIVSSVFFLPFVIFSITPDQYKSLYWIASSTTVFPVSIMFILFTGFMARGFLKGFGEKWISIAIAFIMTLAISTGHEIVIPAIMLVIVAFLLPAFFRRKQYGTLPLSVTLGALAGAVVGSLILVLAPGNYVRMAVQSYPSTPDIFSALSMSFGFYGEFINKLGENWGWVLLTASFIAGIYSKTALPKSWKVFGAILVVTIGSSWGAFLVSTLAISANLPQRTQFIPILFLVFGLYALGAVFPIPKFFPNPTFVAAIAVLLLGFVFTQVIADETKLVAPMEQFAGDWDVRDQKLQTTNIEPYSIEIPWDYKEQQFACMSAYYSK